MTDPFVEKALARAWCKIEWRLVRDTSGGVPNRYHVVKDILTTLHAEAEERGKRVPCPETTGIEVNGRPWHSPACPTCHGDERGIRREYAGAIEALDFIGQMPSAKSRAHFREKYGNREGAKHGD